jgi:hypothetical protein
MRRQEVRANDGERVEELEALATRFNIDTTGVDLSLIHLDDASLSEEDDGLCLCEYTQAGQTRHMLACEDLDNIFHNSCSSGHTVDHGETEQMIARACKERMRMPFPGGAKEVDCGVPVAYCGLRCWYALFMATGHSLGVSLVGVHIVSVIALLSWLRLLSLKTEWATRFFLSWLCLSICALCYEFHICLSSAFSSFFICVLRSHLVLTLAALALSLYWHPDTNARAAALGESHTQSLQRSSCSSYCGLCKRWVLGRAFHCVWLNCCIAAHNQRTFLCFLFLFATLTTEFSWVALIFAPADSDVALLRAAGMYSGVMASAVWLSLCSQIYNISFNIVTSDYSSANKAPPPTELLSRPADGAPPVAQFVGRDVRMVSMIMHAPQAAGANWSRSSEQVIANWRDFWYATPALHRKSQQLV